MFLRVTQGRVTNPANVEQLGRLIEERLVPQLRQQPGFRGYYGAADQEPGITIAVSLWETRAQAEGVSGAVSQLREQLDKLGLALEAPEVYEVLVQA